MEEKPNYYAIIPADVRYDQRLKDKEKLLYGEITALSHKEGYCYSTNSYFAKLYGISKSNISLYINDLIKYGYLESRIVYKDNSKEILERRLYLKGTTPIFDFKNTPILENKNTPILENKKDNNINSNNINMNNINSANTELSVPDKLAYNFNEIWKIYPNKKGKIKAYQYYCQFILGRKVNGITYKLTNEQIYDAVVSYSNEVKDKDKQFILNGSTFFNTRILDYIS